MMDPAEWEGVSDAIVDRVRRDVPGMTKRPGYVQSVGRDGAVITAVVQMAGESGVAQTTVLTGSVEPGDLVMVDFVPPRGAFVTGHIHKADVDCLPVQVPFSQSSTLSTGLWPPWVTDTDRTLRRVWAGTLSECTLAVTVQWLWNGQAQGTLTIPAGDNEASDEDVSVGFRGWTGNGEGDRLTCQITDAGTPEADLTVIFYFDCGLRDLPEAEEEPPT